MENANAIKSRGGKEFSTFHPFSRLYVKFSIETLQERTKDGNSLQQQVSRFKNLFLNPSQKKIVTLLVVKISEKKENLTTCYYSDFFFFD